MQSTSQFTRRPSGNLPGVMAPALPIDSPQATAPIALDDPIQLMAIPGVQGYGETLDLVGNPALEVLIESAEGKSLLPLQVAGIPVIPRVVGIVTASSEIAPNSTASNL